MPGHSQRGDVTHVLRKRHSWPSYNVPYFAARPFWRPSSAAEDHIWRVGGYEVMQEKSKSDEFSFEKCPRALMFERASLPALYHLDPRSYSPWKLRKGGSRLLAIFPYGSHQVQPCPGPQRQRFDCKAWMIHWRGAMPAMASAHGVTSTRTSMRLGAQPA